MIMRATSFLSCALLLMSNISSDAFSVVETQQRKTSLASKIHHDLDKPHENRRNFISNALLSSIMIPSTFANSVSAADDPSDLTSQMFNPDGSLKASVDGTVEAAKERTVSSSFPLSPPSTQEFAVASVDGSELTPATTIATEGGVIKASYQIPDKWTAAPDYLDTLSSPSLAKACDRITVIQVPGTFSNYNQLEKATTIGVAKALGLPSVEKGIFPKSLVTADIISGKKVTKSAGGDVSGDGEKRKYYEFDLVVAPDVCGSSAENLGLGFCPYDTIVLLSATIIDGKMMVCGVTSTKEEWKLSNSDLKRVRSSFFVEKSAV